MTNANFKLLSQGGDGTFKIIADSKFGNKVLDVVNNELANEAYCYLEEQNRDDATQSWKIKDIEGKDGYVEIMDATGEYCLARVSHMNMDDMVMDEEPARKKATTGSGHTCARAVWDPTPCKFPRGPVLAVWIVPEWRVKTNVTL